MNPFAGLNDVSENQGGLYFDPGEYLVEVLGIKLIDSQQHRGDQLYIVECGVLEGTTRDGTAVRGGTRSWIVNMRWPSALSSIRHFLASALGCEFADVTDEVAAGSIAADQPLTGTRLRVEAYHVTTRAGGTFTKMKWRAE